MILAIEIISLCILFTLATVVGTLRDPLGDMKNMPIPLQEYILSLPEYAHLKDLHVVRTKERLLKKIPALILVLVIFALMIRYAGATDFITGFGYTLLLWVVLKLYVTLVLTCGWYAHTKAAWVKGTVLVNPFCNTPFGKYSHCSSLHGC